MCMGLEDSVGGQHGIDGDEREMGRRAAGREREQREEIEMQIRHMQHVLAVVHKQRAGADVERLGVVVGEIESGERKRAAATTAASSTGKSRLGRSSSSSSTDF